MNTALWALFVCFVFFSLVGWIADRQKRERAFVATQCRLRDLGIEDLISIAESTYMCELTMHAVYLYIQAYREGKVCQEKLEVVLARFIASLQLAPQKPNQKAVH